ncbi:hypothetical protein Lcho_0876 [Leptothrix cholodnii SP-6]|uniref:Uncharacterized protein n=1 Tax=Leptothrix cholodnii (strain ATCC 51168 / LMG 8142 / SP-6) TaxID=395495 RepID=B1Y1W8_LEPCP|nr:hypothetical protein [Leptothrix cholodnii]ACB33148.1 hypothetical protein Lcho_0876 [Leptothrix cholodnii SP-6]
MSRTVRKAADRLAVASLGCSRDPLSGPVLQAHGHKGTIQFLLQGTPGGLYVERDECPTHGVRTIQSLLFAERDEFLRWCDEDPVLFEHPLLHERLQRTGLERWDPEPGPCERTALR